MKQLLALLLFCCPLAAQEITITAPTTPIARGSFAFVSVAGISDAELSAASVTLTPPDPNVMTVRLPSPGGITYIVLVSPAAEPGKKTLAVSLNAWRKHLDEAAGSISPNVAEDDSKALRELHQALVAKYPLRIGSAVLEVAGQVPPPPVPPEPGPDPPGPVTPGKRQIVILLERGEATPDQARLITALQSGRTSQSKYLADKGHLLTVLDDDHPSAQPWLPKLGIISPPAVIVVDVQSSSVAGVDALPATADAVIELVKKYGG